MATRDDLGRDHFDRRRGETDVEMPTGYHCARAVASPDGEKVAPIASDSHLVHARGYPARIDRAEGRRTTIRAAVAKVI